MPEQKKEIGPPKKEEIPQKKFAKLNTTKFAITCAIISAILIFLTILAGIFGYFPTWSSMIIEIYGFLGIANKWINLFIFAIFGFVDGFIIGWLFSKLYNILLEYKYIPSKIAGKKIEIKKKP